MIRTRFVCLLLFVSACAGSHHQSTAPTAAPPPPVEVARVDGRTLRADALDAHVKATGLGRAEALDDLVDLDLARAAADKAGLALPASAWTREQRANTELTLAQTLKIEIPPASDLLLVDHAWVKDAAKKKERTADRKTLEKLRGLVASGMHIPEAWKKINVPGDAWHIGDHEQYPYTVVPEQAHDLPPGAVSPLIDGDGGVHLFQIYERKKSPPPADKIRALLREYLRKDATIIQSLAS